MRDPLEDLMDRVAVVRQRRANNLLADLVTPNQDAVLTDELEEGYRHLTRVHVFHVHQLYRARETAEPASKVTELSALVDAYRAGWLILHLHVISLKMHRLRKQLAQLQLDDDVLVELAEEHAEKMIEDIEAI